MSHVVIAKKYDWFSNRCFETESCFIWFDNVQKSDFFSGKSIIVAYVCWHFGGESLCPSRFIQRSIPSTLPCKPEVPLCLPLNYYRRFTYFRLNSSRTGCLSAAAKRYKFVRKLCHFQQMDFEYALWQMLYLFISPQKVYRNFHYRKSKFHYCNQELFATILIWLLLGSKAQFARDDPAFLVLLSLWLCCKHF